MKVVWIVIFTSVVLLSMRTVSNNEQLISLDKAMADGLLDIKVSSTGGYSGKCLEIAVMNKTRKPLNIKIEAGTVFLPEDESMQNIFVVNDQAVALLPDRLTRHQVAGYCCEAGDRCPSDGTAFKVSKMNNSKLLQLSAFMHDKKFDDEVKQNAVWCVSDNHSVSDIWSENPDEVKSLREELCKITGQKNVWYSNKNKVTVDESGIINREPVLVSGEISMTIDHPISFTREILHEDGSVMFTFPGETNVTRTGKFAYDFELTVRGWEEGKYFVQLRNGDQVLLKQEFKV